MHVGMAKEYPQATCDNCRRPFEQRKPWARFCGQTCREAWWVNTRRIASEIARRGVPHDFGSGGPTGLNHNQRTFRAYRASSVGADGKEDNFSTGD